MQKLGTKVLSHHRNDLALLFAVFVWGINIPILKAALAAMPVHVLNVFRFSVSASVLGLLYFYRGTRSKQVFAQTFRRLGRQVIALGFLGYFIYQIFFIVGMDLTTAGNAAIIMASAPIWTAVIGRIFGFEYLHRVEWIGLTVALSGTVVVVLFGSQDIAIRSDVYLGNILMLVASMTWGAYTALSRPIVQQISPLSLAFFGLLVALPFLISVGIPYVDQVDWGNVDLWVWSAIVFSGGLSTGVTIVLWTTAVREVGASHTAIYGNLVPFIAVLSSAILLNETISLQQILGGLLIISGLVLVRRSRKRALVIPDTN